MIGAGSAAHQRLTIARRTHGENYWYDTVAFRSSPRYNAPAESWSRPAPPALSEDFLMRSTSALVGVVAGLALVTMPLSSASAHGRHGSGLLFGLAAVGTAVVVGVATLATAPVRALAAIPAAPVYAPPAYAPPPVYAMRPPVYAAPPVYAMPPPVYAAPPGYVYVR
jgi:hypothetical protein